MRRLQWYKRGAAYRVRKEGLIAPIKNNMDALLIENP